MTNTDALIATLYPTRSEARAEAWAEGFRVVPRSDTTDIMARGEDIIRMEAGANCFHFRLF